MTKLLLKCFAKDPNDRATVGALAGTTGIVCNVLLFLGKLVAGLVSGSIALMSDAFNNLSDAASSVTTLLGFRMAKQPADRDHPYGHARYEYLSGLGVAALILLIGFELARDSVVKIFRPEPVQITALTYWILIPAMLLKLWMSRFFHSLGKHIDSAALMATAADSRNDVLATGAVLLGCLCQQFLEINLDGFIGLGVAAFIFWSGIGAAKETISPLIGRQADRELVQSISELILRHEKVLGIHDLLIHDYGPGQCFASVHVEISAEEHPMESHDIIDDIERDAMAELNVHLVIHYDPVQLHDREQERMQRKVKEILNEISTELSIHDFRLLRTETGENLYFDLEVPYDMKITKEALQQRIAGRLPSQYTAVISFDGK